VAADSEDLVILASTVLIQSQSTMDRQTERQTHTVRQMPRWQLRCVKHYKLSHVKNRATLNFACFDSLICIVTHSREKSRSLSLIPFHAS